MKIFIYISLVLLLSSCSFNFMFLHPDKIDFEEGYSARKSMDFETKDTLWVEFNNTHIPNFKLIADDTVPDSRKLSYNIRSCFIPNGHEDSLNAWVITPKDSANGTLLYFLHGNAGNVVSQYQEMIPFVNMGYSTVVLDYSGFGFSTGRATRRNVLRDANTAFDHIISDTSIHYNRLLIYGQSLGGHLSAVVAEKNQEFFDGLIIEGAFSSHKDVGADMAGVLARIFVKEGYSAKKSIRNYNGSSLIVHSKEDQMIPIVHGKRLYSAANFPKSFLEIDKCHICGPFYYADTIAKGMRKL